MSVLAIAIISVGLFFLLVAAIGMIRLPDVFSRAHALGLTDALGSFCLLVGLAIHEGFSLNALKILVVLALLYMLNPVISHATIRAALRSGLKPWEKNGR